MPGVEGSFVVDTLSPVRYASHMRATTWNGLSVVTSPHWTGRQKFFSGAFVFTFQCGECLCRNEKAPVHATSPNFEHRATADIFVVKCRACDALNILPTGKGRYFGIIR